MFTRNGSEDYHLLLSLLLPEPLPMRLLALLSFLLLCIVAYPQKTNQNYKPSLVTQPPETAALARFGNYPVDYFSGTVDVEIPIHEISVGDVKIPISFKYHTGGIKVNDRASRVGLGWSLSAGGSITRTIQGLEDDHYAGLLNTVLKPLSEINVYSQQGLDYLNNFNRGIKDGDPDIFSFNVAGLSGQFFFDRNKGNRIVQMPYSATKISRVGVLDFQIVNDNGTTFNLDASETDDTDRGVKTAWLPSSIVSSTLADSVKFFYQTRSGQTRVELVDNLVVSDQVYNMSETFFSPDQGIQSSSLKGVFSTEKLLSEIRYPLGKVVFESNVNDREDGFIGQKKLDRVRVFSFNPDSQNPILIKTVELHHSYFFNSIANVKRLRLDSISVLSSSGQLIQRYRFEYVQDIHLPEYTSRSKDFWGYYNGKDNSSLIPRTSIDFIPAQGSTPTTIFFGSGEAYAWESVPSYARAYVLKKIVYPTGGWTEFEFEGNSFLENGETKYAGGLRVRQLKNYDAISQSPNVKTFKYGDGENGYGRKNFVISNYFFQDALTHEIWREFNPDRPDFCPTLVASKRERFFFSYPSVSVEPFDGVPVMYSQVTEYEGTEANNIGKTVYTFSDRADQMVTPVVQGKPLVRSYKYERGLLNGISVFKNTGTGYQLVKRTTNQYKAFGDSVILSAGFQARKSKIQDYKTPSYFNEDISSVYTNCSFNGSEHYTFGFYGINIGDAKLVSTTETIYDQNNPLLFVEQSTSYEYNDFQHQQVTAESSLNSEGKQISSQFRYVTDFPGSVHAEMVSKNILTNPVEITTSKGGAQLEKVRFVFSKYGNSVFKPSSILRKIGSGPEEVEVSFGSYNEVGNPETVIGKDGVPTSYIFGYGGRLAIAEAVNATMGASVISSNVSELVNISSSTGGQLPLGNAFFLGEKQVIAGTGAITMLGVGGPTPPNVSIQLKDASGTVWFARAKSYGSFSYSLNLPAGEYRWHYSATFTLVPNFYGIRVEVNHNYSNTYKNIFHTSFEENGIVDAAARTGQRVWVGTFQFVSPSQPGNYLVSYWKSLNTLPRVWSLVTTTVQAGGLITIGQSNEVIDEVRMHPVNSKMKTFSFLPGYGIYTQSDFNHIRTMYRYDEAGRLQAVLDDKEDLLKTMQYNYKNK